MMRICVRLAVCLLLGLGLSACEGARAAGSGAKAVGHGVVSVLAAPSKLLAGHPPDYAKKQGMTEADLAADAPPDIDKSKLKKTTKVKPSVMSPGF